MAIPRACRRHPVEPPRLSEPRCHETLLQIGLSSLQGNARKKAPQRAMARDAGHIEGVPLAIPESQIG